MLNVIRIIGAATLFLMVPVSYAATNARGTGTEKSNGPSTEGSSARSTESWRNFEEGSVNSLPETLSSIVVFRSDSGAVGKAVNVYVNGEYLSSLQPGAYTQTPVCPGENSVNVGLSDVRNRYIEKSQPGLRVKQHPGVVSYFTIDAKDGVLVASAVDDARAAEIMSGLRRKQHHTISRVTPRACELK